VKSYPKSGEGHIVMQVILPLYDHFAGKLGHNEIQYGIPVELSPHKGP
jgi:hypothetical protein